MKKETKNRIKKVTLISTIGLLGFGAGYVSAKPAAGKAAWNSLVKGFRTVYGKINNKLNN